MEPTNEEIVAVEIEETAPEVVEESTEDVSSDITEV